MINLFSHKRGAYSVLQRKLLFGCFIAYLCAYLGRLNLSAALDDIMRALGADKAMGGALQTAFAAVYAAGQFVNGMLADRFDPRRMIAMGLVGSAACNLAFSMSDDIIMLAALWALNGACQSMLWTPIVRLLAANFEPEKRGGASFLMSFTLAGGHFIAWALAGGMAARFGWRYSFAIPALIMLLGVLCAVFLLPRARHSAPAQADSPDITNAPAAGAPALTKSERQMPIVKLLATGLAPLLICCLINGFLRDGVITWAPTILKERASSGALTQSMFSLIIPLINLAGILFGRCCVHVFSRNTRVVAGLMMGACALPALLLALTPNAPMFICALLLGLVSALLYGTNPMYTALIPLNYDRAGRVGLVAGLMDCFIYLGSALAGAFTGWLEGAFMGWSGVYLCWTAVALASVGLSFLSARGARRL